MGPPGCIPGGWTKQHYPHVGWVTIEHACRHQTVGGVPPPAAPARPRVWVTHMRPPIQARGLYSGRQHNGRPGFSGSPAGSGSHPGYLQAKPCALQHSPEMTPYWAFRPSPMGLAQNCCRGLRARTETSTYPGRCACAPTPAPILGPQDHCKSAQVWPTQRAGGRRRMGKPHSSNPRNT